MGDSALARDEVTSERPPLAGRAVPILWSVIAILAVGVIVLVVLLLVNRDTAASAPTPSPSPTAAPTELPTPTPSASPTPDPTQSAAPVETAAPSGPDPVEPPPPPAPVGPTFTAFTAPNQAGCSDDSGSVEIQFSWSTTNAAQAWFGIATNNAKAAPYEEVAVQVGSYTAYYQCSEPSQVYTVTIEDAEGNLTHESRSISRN